MNIQSTTDLDSTRAVGPPEPPSRQQRLEQRLEQRLNDSLERIRARLSGSDSGPSGPNPPDAGTRLDIRA